MIQEETNIEYPLDWYYFDFSNKIKTGKIYNYHYFNTPLVCFRNSHGEINVFDAYCPHLGAHLGMGGKIENDCLVCPFHGWKYDSSGKCVEIPYCKTIPKKAALKRYVTEEINSCIFIQPNTEGRLSKNALETMTVKRCKPLLTKVMPLLELNKWIQRIKTMSFHLESRGPGFLLVESDFGIALLIYFTPINNTKASVSLSFSVKQSLKNLCPFAVRRRVKKRFAGLFEIAGIL